MSAGWFRSTSVTLRPDGESAAAPIRAAVSREGEQIASSQVIEPVSAAPACRLMERHGTR